MKMKEEKLEKKIRKSTKNRDYEKSKEILISYYIKHFKKMIKYKKNKINKTWYLYDYLKEIRNLYSSFYSSDVDEMIDILYSNKYSTKQQILWLLENSYIFNDYKL